ncbi:unnamed protein product [Mesocestoides corti]|uniref:Transforming acidic coiled-coil-containing protein C-terminal domain-containing protein n=1 Tax=Mesocestoides corti TaxID=53468 RepID=A0A158QU62_MESCO|nr:unnamed protein product [Mesocestoides corti]
MCDRKGLSRLAPQEIDQLLADSPVAFRNSDGVVTVRTSQLRPPITLTSEDFALLDETDTCENTPSGPDKPRTLGERRSSLSTLAHGRNTHIGHPIFETCTPQTPAIPQRLPVISPLLARSSQLVAGVVTSLLSPWSSLSNPCNEMPAHSIEDCESAQDLHCEDSLISAFEKIAVAEEKSGQDEVFFSPSRERDEENEGGSNLTIPPPPPPVVHLRSAMLEDTQCEPISESSEYSDAISTQVSPAPSVRLKENFLTRTLLTSPETSVCGTSNTTPVPSVRSQQNVTTGVPTEEVDQLTSGSKEAETSATFHQSITDQVPETFHLNLLSSGCVLRCEGGKGDEFENKLVVSQEFVQDKTTKRQKAVVQSTHNTTPCYYNQNRLVVTQPNISGDVAGEYEPSITAATFKQESSVEPNNILTDTTSVSHLRAALLAPGAQTPHGAPRSLRTLQSNHPLAMCRLDDDDQNARRQSVARSRKSESIISEQEQRSEVEIMPQENVLAFNGSPPALENSKSKESHKRRKTITLDQPSPLLNSIQSTTHAPMAVESESTRSNIYSNSGCQSVDCNSSGASQHPPRFIKECITTGIEFEHDDKENVSPSASAHLTIECRAAQRSPVITVTSDPQPVPRQPGRRNSVETELVVDRYVTAEDEKVLLRKEIDALRTKEDILRMVLGNFRASFEDALDQNCQMRFATASAMAQAGDELGDAKRQVTTLHAAVLDSQKRNDRMREIIGKKQEAQEELLKHIEALKTKYARQSEKGETYQKYCLGKIQKALEHLDSVKSLMEKEISKLRVCAKQLEMKQKSLEAELKQKAQENQELTRICDSLLT